MDTGSLVRVLFMAPSLAPPAHPLHAEILTPAREDSVNRDRRAAFSDERLQKTRLQLIGGGVDSPDVRRPQIVHALSVQHFPVGAHDDDEVITASLRHPAHDGLLTTFRLPRNPFLPLVGVWRVFSRWRHDA